MRYAAEIIEALPRGQPVVRLLRFIEGSESKTHERSDVVKVLCAWCVRDGKPAFLREKSPLSDVGETHGLCGDHFTSLRAGVGQVVDSRWWLVSHVNDLCGGLTRWGQRLMGRLLVSLC